jgi:hypothetical protein
LNLSLRRNGSTRRALWLRPVDKHMVIGFYWKAQEEGIQSTLPRFSPSIDKHMIWILNTESHVEARHSIEAFFQESRRVSKYFVRIINVF